MRFLKWLRCALRRHPLTGEVFEGSEMATGEVLLLTFCSCGHRSDWLT